MNRKHFILPSLLMLGFLASCGDDDVKGGYDSFGGEVANLVVSDNGGATTASKANYSFTFNFDNSILDFGCGGLHYKNYTNGGFAIQNKIRFQAQNYANGSVRTFSYAGPEGTNGLGDAQISDIRGSVITVLYYNPVSVYSVERKTFLDLTYHIGDATVVTFDPNPFYGGSTTTSYDMDGERKSFTTGQMVYNVTLNPENNTADVTIYNARFAEEMKRSITVALTGLPVTYVGYGYRIDASGVIPVMREGGVTTPMPLYTFDRFTFSVDNVQSDGSASVDYQVAGKYTAVGSLKLLTL